MKANLKHIFENAKDGDGLAFYRKAWYLQIIPFFTRETKSEEAPQHIGLIYEVKRTKSTICFRLSEQNFHGGQYRNIDIYKISDKYFINDDYFNKQNKIALLSLKTPLTQSQLEIGLTDAIKQKGKKYGYLELPKGIEFLEKILPQKIKTYFLNKQTEDNARHCALHAFWNYYKMGLIEKKDFNPTPIEITKLPIFNVIV